MPHTWQSHWDLHSAYSVFLNEAQRGEAALTDFGGSELKRPSSLIPYAYILSFERVLI